MNLIKAFSYRTARVTGDNRICLSWSLVKPLISELAKLAGWHGVDNHICFLFEDENSHVVSMWVTDSSVIMGTVDNLYVSVNGRWINYVENLERDTSGGNFALGKKNY